MNFNATKEDAALLRQAAIRARKMDIEANGPHAQDIMDWSMDLTACHCNGTPLDLDKLLAFDDFNFAHDAFGISRHINRTTGRLKDCFLPRASRKTYSSKQPGAMGMAIRQRKRDKATRTPK